MSVIFEIYCLHHHTLFVYNFKINQVIMSGKSKPENKLKRKKTEELETDTFPTDPPGKSSRVNLIVVIVCICN